MRRKSKAQSVLEYTLILAAVVAAVVAAATKYIRPAMDKSFNDASSAITQATSNFADLIGNGN